MGGEESVVWQLFMHVGGRAKVSGKVCVCVCVCVEFDDGVIGREERTEGDATPEVCGGASLGSCTSHNYCIVSRVPLGF